MTTNEIFLYSHGGSKNHGCEAILRTTISLLSQNHIAVYSFRPKEDREYCVDNYCRLLDRQEMKPNKLSVGFLFAYFRLRFKQDESAIIRYYEKLIYSRIPANSIALSIGGDNYCYSDVWMHMENRAFLEKRGHKTVLWGCSVEPSLIDTRMRKDLSRYDLITARESITYETLRKINSNVVLAPDPAFTLRKQPGNYPEGLGRKPYIGINVSPLIQSLEKDGNITMENYRALVAHILETTDRDIALIPHVVWDHNDDRIPLGQLYEEFRNTGRVFMVEDQNCMQLKDIISGCEFFVGARTHATIAAYSTCVPTLVVGYSVKARGIARDLFGSEEGYVLPVQQLRNSGELTDAFHGLYSRKEEIREYLSNMMPNYIAGIEAAKEAVERL